MFHVKHQNINPWPVQIDAINDAAHNTGREYVGFIPLYFIYFMDWMNTKMTEQSKVEKRCNKRRKGRCSLLQLIKKFSLKGKTKYEIKLSLVPAIPVK
jgi:hypothetical protein